MEDYTQRLFDFQENLSELQVYFNTYNEQYIKNNGEAEIDTTSLVTILESIRKIQDRIKPNGWIDSLNYAARNSRAEFCWQATLYFLETGKTPPINVNEVAKLLEGSSVGFTTKAFKKGAKQIEELREKETLEKKV
ncbi:hypothetical protein GF358_04805 [Candidatus Woesearchaeota archaeon]|nr:hypothetical protein [Candidatus Woesearchaeota archaeon]